MAGFKAPLIVILLVALLFQLILFFAGKTAWYEPFGILVAIMIANGVAAVFENKQENKAADLRRAENAKEKAKVVRDSSLIEIPLNEIVVGDVVFLQAGDKIPADGILLDGTLKVDQSALNGESEETAKSALTNGAEYDTRDLLNRHYIYRGTVICGGEAYQEVQVVGDQTLFGQAALAAQEKPRKTPLQLKLGKLASQISWFGYIGAATIIFFIFLTTILTGKSPDNWSDWLRLAIDAFTVAVTIIVCAVPEGLPMLSSILQALQSLQMVKDNVLVRKINGLETAGSLSILFCDKTGTITEGRLSVVEFALGNCQVFYQLTSLQDALKGELITGIGTNNSSIATSDAVLGGNSTDRALMAFLVANGQSKTISRNNVVAFNAFDSNQKCSSVVLQTADEFVTYIKGAPERILDKCVKYLDSNGQEQIFSDKTKLNDYLNEQAGRSMRLLAVAKTHGKSPDGPLTLIGILSIRDNVRKEVKNAIAEIQNAGIQVVLVTGDRKETAVAIAKEAGLLSKEDDVELTSFDMAKMTDDELKAILPRLRVVSRALPMDKRRLVKLSQEQNLVVGMTGDGVNDSPALRKADVGFAMGSGTEVAKMAGEITILDDNLASIEKAILYGRTVFKSIRKFLVFQLTVNVAAVLLCAIGPLFGINKVMTVIQLLLINLAMDTLAAIAFGSEPPQQEFMNEQPVPRSQGLVTRKMFEEIIISSIYITVVCLAILLVPGLQHFIGVKGETYRQSALFAIFMMAITLNGFNIRTEHLNPFEGMTRNLTFIVIMGLIFILQYLFVTFGGKALEVTPLSLETWTKCLLLALLVIPIDILRKIIASPPVP